MEDIKPTITRRIRIWEGKKCIMAIDLQGDTIVTRSHKKNLKVPYEAFGISMENYKINNFEIHPSKPE